jgi:hypothetical protein
MSRSTTGGSVASVPHAEGLDANQHQHQHPCRRQRMHAAAHDRVEMIAAAAWCTHLAVSRRTCRQRLHPPAAPPVSLGREMRSRREHATGAPRPPAHMSHHAPPQLQTSARVAQGAGGEGVSAWGPVPGSLAVPCPPLERSTVARTRTGRLTGQRYGPRRGWRTAHTGPGAREPKRLL